MSDEIYTGISVKPDTREGLQILKAKMGHTSYDSLLKEELLEEQSEVDTIYIGE